MLAKVVRASPIPGAPGGNPAADEVRYKGSIRIIDSQFLALRGSRVTIFGRDFSRLHRGETRPSKLLGGRYHLLGSNPQGPHFGSGAVSQYLPRIPLPRFL